MNTWEDIINQESKKEYFLELMEKINIERTNYIVYPKEVDIFKAFELTPLNKVKEKRVNEERIQKKNHKKKINKMFDIEE